MKADYPYIHGQPVEIGPLGWLAIMGALVVGFALLVTLPFSGFPFTLVPAIAFTGLPLVTLALVSGGHHGALFGRFGFREAGMVVGFGVLTLLVSFVTAIVLIQFAPLASNPNAGALDNVSGLEMASFLLRTAIQLVGEELLTVLPLLGVLWLCVRRLGLSQRVGLAIAVVVSTAIFAAAHLPTYNWNLLQCFVGIGMARLVLTLAFLLTRNLWVSTGAHILNDWTEFFIGHLLSGAGHGPIEPV